MSTPDFARMVESSAQELLNDLSNIVQESAAGHDALQDHVAAGLRQAGAEVSRVRYNVADVRVSHEVGVRPEADREEAYVVGTYGSGDDGLLFWAHSDSEPVDAAGWNRPPFEGAIEGGRMYGWGIGDDLVGIASMLALAKLGARHGLFGPRRTLLASVPSKNRAQGIIHALDAGFTASSSIYLHPAESGIGLGEIKAIAPGLLRFRVRIHGSPPATTEPGHTVFSHLAADPVRLAQTVMAELHAFGERRASRVHHPEIDEAVGRSTNLHIPHVTGGDPTRLGKVPSHVDLYVAISFPPGESLSGVQEEVVAELARISSNDAHLALNPLQPEWLVGLEGADIPRDSRLYRLTNEAITAVTGSEPILNPLHAGSDIRNPWLHSRIATVGIGPLVGNLTVNGNIDEWADVDDYLRMVETICRIAFDHSH